MPLKTPTLMLAAAVVVMGCTHTPQPNPPSHTAADATLPPAAAQPNTTTPADPEPVAAPEPEPENPTRSASAGPLTLYATPQYTGWLRGAEGELSVIVELAADDTPNLTRQPLDLALVIDRSGSMRGDKLSAVKLAALELIQQLQDTDRVTLVTYESQVDTLYTLQTLDPNGRRALRDTILAIQSDGGTALGPALINTLALFPDRTSDRVAHTLLLSDGRANEGEQRPKVLGGHAANAFRTGVSVSTLGVGLDYNEDLMTLLADMGGGRYHFVDAPDALPGVISDELAGLMSASTRATTLTLEPAPGTTLRDVVGYPTEHNPDGSITITVGGIRAGSRRDLVLTFDVTDDATEDTTTRPISTLTVDFEDLSTPPEATPRSLSTQLELDRLDTADAVAQSEVLEVTVRITEVTAALQLEKAAIAVATGDFDRAASVLDTSIQSVEAQRIRTPDDALDAQLIELESARKDLEVARKSKEEQKRYVKSKKSSAYKSKKKSKKKSSRKKKSKLETKEAPFNIPTVDP